MKRLLMWMMAALLALGAGWAQAADLTLGPGDVIKASVFGNPDMATETRVSDSGRITFPLLGEVKVGGLSVQQAERAIGEHLMIGLAALDNLRMNRTGLHSRKLRSFDEPPFR